MSFYSFIKIQIFFIIGFLLNKNTAYLLTRHGYFLEIHLTYYFFFSILQEMNILMRICHKSKKKNLDVAVFPNNFSSVLSFS